MTADPNDLTTLATLKNYLNPGSNDDTLLQRLLTSASFAIESYLNRAIKSASFTDVFDGTGGRVLLVPQYPITAVTSVTIDGVAIPSAGGPTTPGFYFTDTKIILSGYYFTKGLGNVAITYTAGWATVPFDIEQACIDTVQYWLGNRQRNSEVSRSMGGQTISYSQKDMPDWTKTILAQYKRVITV
jgi:hypothetical protein